MKGETLRQAVHITARLQRAGFIRSRDSERETLNMARLIAAGLVAEQLEADPGRTLGLGELELLEALQACETYGERVSMVPRVVRFVGTPPAFQ